MTKFENTQPASVEKDAQQAQLISIVIPCFNESEGFPVFQTEILAIAQAIEQRNLATEIVLVDDGSRDDTWNLICELAAKDRRVRGAALSRNFGQQSAISCGYDLAAGDAVVCLDADLQDPPDVLLEMIDKWRQGFDVVLGVRRTRTGESTFKLWTAKIFYQLLRLLGARHIRADCGDFRLMSRRSLMALQQMPEYHRFIRGMVGWAGFPTAEIFYDRRARRAGQTKYPLSKMIRLALDAIISFSSAPLRLAYLSSGLLMLATLGYLVYVLIIHVVFGVDLVPGWASLLLTVIGFGSMNLFCLGLMGEYVGRIYEEVKHRPHYIVRDQTPLNRPMQNGAPDASSDS